MGRPKRLYPRGKYRLRTPREADKEQVLALMEYYKTCPEPRRKELLEMFFFAFHACGLRVVDVMILQWSHINFERKELRKIMIKTNKRHVIPLTEPALRILLSRRNPIKSTNYSSSRRATLTVKVIRRP